MSGPKHAMADFSSLRAAFETLSEIYRTNGRVATASGGVRISGIAKHRWKSLFAATVQNGAMMKHLVQGAGQRASVSGRREVVLSVVAENRDGQRYFEVAALLVKGRGTILETISLTSRKDDWKPKLREFVDWEEIDAVLPAAEGNNQRAMIGLALQLAGIGRGKLEMVEAELPEEVDEATHLVRGADWMKAGLPRFGCAAAEALYYLMRLRSVHSRMIRIRKQGYYTSMALAALHASGLRTDEVATLCNIPEGLVEKLTPKPTREARDSRLVDLGAAFGELDTTGDDRRSHCAARVWRGAAIYAHLLDRRVRTGAEARSRLAAGDDLVSISADLGVARRDLVETLSVRMDAAVEEKGRFVAATIDPELVRSVARDAGSEGICAATPSH